VYVRKSIEKRFAFKTRDVRTLFFSFGAPTNPFVAFLMSIY
jgi:hypothetical protein